MRSPALTLLLMTFAAAAQQGPDVGAQKEAMKKLSFLVGTWKGDATSYQQRGPVKVHQTEQVQYKLDGLVMLVEGTGRNPETGQVQFGALATISYDDAAKVYRFRAHNDGRFLDTELKVSERGFAWGYEAGPAKVSFVMTLTAAGEWQETGQVSVNGGPPRKSVELLVKRQ